MERRGRTGSAWRACTPSSGSWSGGAALTRSPWVGARGRGRGGHLLRLARVSRDGGEAAVRPAV
eukprot:3198249-Pyramimonas_sp.AAC.1